MWSAPLSSNMIISTSDKKIKGRTFNNFFNYSYRYYSNGEIEITWFSEYKLIGRNGGRKMPHLKDDISEENRKLYREQSIIRAGSKIRQLIKENNLAKMWTMTYEKEITDRDTALSDFKKFMKRLNYHLTKKVHYVAIMEIQRKRYEETGKPVLHFHMAIDNRYIDKHQLQDIWGHGNVYYSETKQGRKLEGASDIAGYMSKYLKKDMMEYPDSIVPGKKVYLNSKGMSRPNIGYGIASEQEKDDFKSIAYNYEITEGITASMLNINKIIHT